LRKPNQDPFLVNCGDATFAEDLAGGGHANSELPRPHQRLILPVLDEFDIRYRAAAP